MIKADSIRFRGRTLVSIVELAVAPVFASAAHGERAIEITKPADIAAAESVHAAVDSLWRQAAICKTPGLACACGLRPGLGRLSASYHAAIRTHPEWTDAGVQYVVRANGRATTIAVFFPGLRRQLDMCHVP
jgi:hypothetical protein